MTPMLIKTFKVLGLCAFALILWYGRLLKLRAGRASLNFTPILINLFIVLGLGPGYFHISILGFGASIDNFILQQSSKLRAGRASLNITPMLIKICIVLGLRASTLKCVGFGVAITTAVKYIAPVLVCAGITVIRLLMSHVPAQRRRRRLHPQRCPVICRMRDTNRRNHLVYDGLCGNTSLILEALGRRLSENDAA